MLTEGLQFKRGGRRILSLITNDLIILYFLVVYLNARTNNEMIIQLIDELYQNNWLLKS